MATSKSTTKNVQIGGFNVWWDGKSEIILQSTTHDSDIPGSAMAVAFSSNPDSANYHPVNFNKMAALLRLHGKDAPNAIPEAPRELALRGFVRAVPV